MAKVIDLQRQVDALTAKLKDLSDENVRLNTMINDKYTEDTRNLLEFEGRLRFIRTFDYICNQNRCHWSVVGEFVRMMFSNHTLHDTKLEIRVNTFRVRDACTIQYVFEHEILCTLQMMGLIRDAKTPNGSVYEYDIQELVDGNLVTFPLVVYCNESHKPQFGCELMNVSPYGMSLSRRDITLDRFNSNHGIGLLNHILDIKKKCARALNTYVNVPTSFMLRVDNATLMRKHAKMLKEGYTVEQKDFIIQTDYESENECPICMEGFKHSTKLCCGHSFCLECLASHMEMYGEQYGRCPLCRGDIILDV